MPLTEKVNLKLEQRYKNIIDLMYYEKCGDEELEKAIRQKARIKILKMIGIITVLVKKGTPDCLVRLNGMLAAAYLMLTWFCPLDCRSSQKHLIKSATIISQFEEEPYLMLLKHKILNVLAKMKLAVGDHQNGLSYLSEAEDLFWKSKIYTPVKISEMFLTSAEPLEKTNSREDYFVETMFVRADIFKDLKDELRAAIFTQMGLQIQFNYSNFNRVTWIQTATSVSLTFTRKFGFKQAGHLLAAAKCVYEKYSSQISYNSPPEVMSEFYRIKTNFYETLGVYGLELLRFSKLVSVSDGAVKRCIDLSQSDLEGTSATKEEFENLRFPNLSVRMCQLGISNKIIVTNLDARHVFIRVDRWLEIAENNANNLSEIYIGIVINRSMAYGIMALAEADSEIKYDLLLKRIDLLEKLKSEIVEPPNVVQRKRFWENLGRSFGDLAEYEIYENEPTTNSVKRIKFYIKYSIQYLEFFLNSFRNCNTYEFPSDRIIEIDDEVDFLAALVKVAYLCQLFIDAVDIDIPEHEQIRRYMLQAVVNYCERHPDAQKHLNIYYIKPEIHHMYWKMHAH